MTADQLAGIMNLAVEAEKTAVVGVKDIIDFFESKGADANQIAANRALLTQDITAIDTELKADGQ